MPKICFLGAGSTVFAINVLGDCLLVDSLKGSHITLVDIDPDRLEVSRSAIENLNRTVKGGARIESYLAEDASKALENADYVVNAIQVGGYEPSTVLDFEIPKKYGLRQTIGDTLGIGGIFRGLRTIPVMLKYCQLIEKHAPDALLLNYTNPMAIVTGAILKGTSVRAVGLCHSVQSCARHLCAELDMPHDDLQWRIAGINHQGWLLEISRHGQDLYPEIKRRAELPEYKHKDAVRFEIMKWFGFYVTESSEHSSEYVPWFIKQRAPELIQRFGIPLDEYPRRCIAQIKGWEALKTKLLSNESLTHQRTEEYASYIFDAIETGRPYVFGGNVLNSGLITNLPTDACVEVMCLADRNGITPTYVGALPPQCAALNRTNINVQELTIEAALTRRKEHIYQAALLDPHTAAELTIDEIVSLCNDLLEAHAAYLPEYS
ncbi:MAG TPA: alpha-glucosidase/alpha-galactosidase [Candidatus Hydrogenedentes bacterium]|nr:alpha-glucosidase/alpha-galactosidase [Candidatus Hydrogenedentota bacterium]HOL77577.1 alpha-glucosidase/alpha-galactosidase [Candidatus Hydrogenedentota bacterium]HPO84882.1 alpha-glucosidase/alpha-galactosidase [Candidatus Hydrogenedentota bacterium]